MTRLKRLLGDFVLLPSVWRHAFDSERQRRHELLPDVIAAREDQLLADLTSYGVPEATLQRIREASSPGRWRVAT